MRCPNCGYENAETSRFCRQCGTALSAVPTARTDDVVATGAPMAVEDAALQEDLLTQPAKQDTPATQPATGTPATSAASSAMAAQPAQLAPGTNVEGYTIVALRDENAATRTYRAEAPSDICAQCGTPANEPNARFCEECGADLLPREVLLVEQVPEQQTGAAYIIELPDEPIKALLPPVNALEHEASATSSSRTWYLAGNRSPSC